MKALSIVSILVLLLAAGGSFAQNKLYRVVDTYGNVTYQDQPPTGNQKYETRDLPAEETPAPQVSDGDSAEEIIAEASRSRPLVLFTVPRCDTCDFVRWFLEERKLPYEEVNVEGNLDNQKRLRDATGEFRVPVLMVGEVPLFGYDREDLTSELESAGYIPPESQEVPRQEYAPLPGEAADATGYQEGTSPPAQ